MQKLTFFAALALIACSPALGLELRFLGDLNKSVGGQYRETTIGGLSALSCDPATGRMSALSDDRSQINPARYYDFQLTFAPQGFSVDPIGVTFLRRPDGSFFPPRSLDPEGFARRGSRTFFSSEGDQGVSPRIPPGVFEIDPSGQVIGQLPIPEKFIAESVGDQTRGVLDNKAFESLTFSGDRLYTATELALFQDDSEPTFEKGAMLRILEFSGLEQGPVHTREFAYPIDAVRKRFADEEYGDQGLSDMLALGNGHFLAIERGGTIRNQAWRTQVRLYDFTLDGATEISALTSLRGATYAPVRKQLVIDLDTILEKLTPGYQSIDNIEGICLGPASPNGLPTLILVSDDNFNSHSQRTQFLAFEMLY